MDVRNSHPAAPVRLRPGRHGLSRDEVLSSQRGRMLVAVARAVARKGYADATVADVLVGSGVSRATFYEHFDGKEQCYAEAYGTAAALVRDALLRPPGEQSNPADRLRAALRGYLAVLDGDPDLANAFLIQSAAAGPRVRALRARSHAEWADALQALACDAADRAGAPPPPPLAGQSAVGALVHAVEQRLASAPGDGPLAALADGLDAALSRLLLPPSP